MAHGRADPTEFERLRAERDHAIERQAALGEVLKAIANAPAELAPVLDTIAMNARRYCGAEDVLVLLAEGDQVISRAHAGPIALPSRDSDASTVGRQVPLVNDTVIGRAILQKRTVHVDDLQTAEGFATGRERARSANHRTTLAVPLLRDGRAIGAIMARRIEVRPFSEDEIALIETFADQAVIAIENVRLLNETKEALEQQTAVSEVLATISRSAFDLQPVLDTVTERATRLSRATQGTMHRVEGDMLHFAAGFGPSEALMELSRRNPIQIGDRGTLTGRVSAERRTVHLPDVLQDPEYTYAEAQRLGGFRAMLGVPLLQEGHVIGVMSLWRTEPIPFGEKEIALVETFADQAAIAIGNVRLLNETKGALDQQTAIGEVLRVISRSPTDVSPVLEAVVANAVRLSGADSASLVRIDNDVGSIAASVGQTEETEATLRAFHRTHRIVAGRESLTGRVLLERRSVQIADASTDPDYEKRGGTQAALSLLGVPLLGPDGVIGVLIARRAAPHVFSARQVAVVESFADQAVIAIENVRLFNETKEALERQTAVSEVLATISRSTFDLPAVLQTIAERAMALANADEALIFRIEGSDLVLVTRHPVGGPEYLEGFLTVGGRQRADGATLPARAVKTLSAHYAEDVRLDPSLPQSRTRTRFAVPIQRDGRALGVIVVAHVEVAPFTERQRALVETFADQAAIAIENVRLFNETREALDRQTATSEILKVISGSPTDIQPVLDAIASSAVRYTGAEDAAVLLLRGSSAEPMAHEGPLAVPFAITLDRGSVSGAALIDSTLVHVADVTDGDDYPASKRLSFENDGQRTVLAAPLTREGRAIGVLVLRRREVRPFTERQVDLARVFADQAVIAIENVRLFNETREALDRQTATSEILKVISGSPTDIQPVLDAIAESAVRFCGAEDAAVVLVRGDQLRVTAHHGPIPLLEVPREDLDWPADRTSVTGRAIVDRRTTFVDDIQAESDAEYSVGKKLSREPPGGGALRERTTLATPLIREGHALGAIMLRRLEVRPFTEKQIELVETFADQAVIAIENVRLFNETKEALERQTATGEILRVIAGSPLDVHPVLETIARSASQFCAAENAAVILTHDDQLHAAASHGPLASAVPDFPLDRRTVTGRAIVERRVVHVHDLWAESDDEYPIGKQQAKAMGHRTTLAAPMIREGRAIGAILLRRGEVRPFSERQIDLVQTFADQAVIAIENVRLFNETREALARQTATAEILEVINRSAGELRPVYQAVLDAAERLLDAESAGMHRVVDGQLEFVALGRGVIPRGGQIGLRMPIGDSTVAGRAVLHRMTVHVPDVSSEPRLPQNPPWTRLAVPIMRGNDAVGVITVGHAQARPFTAHQIELLETFAGQVAIAMENVRLFNETKEALEQQTATSEVLQAISRSAFDLQGVLDTVVERAAQLCGAQQGWMRRIEGDRFRFAAYYGASAELRAMFEEMRAQGEYAAIDYTGMGGRAVLERRPIHVHDVTADADLRGASLIIRGGGRTGLAIPMLRDGEPIGAIVVARDRVAPFTDREIHLIEMFADQAVIAIENVRLFDEIQEKGRLLEAANRHKSEFLANMSHELRTPLNAIIGFSEVLLQGMFGELNAKQREYQQDVLSSGRHLLALINDILDLAKIEAGRTDLELSEFSLRDALENGVTMVRERALRHGIGLALTLDGVERITADERKVKQIVFNLLSNAVKFTPDRGQVNIQASRSDALVRVAVRDTGIGIDERDRERIFQEFQQASRDPERSREGTGLGLTLTRRFVELHGGRIWVESEAGKGSTFTFTLPQPPAR